jgi:5-(carboxyamino)imidazole ribonucleotide synthase
MMALPAGSVIGMLGGGQLARMMCMAAARLGYRTTVFDPDPNAPAAQVANFHVAARYDDEAALASLAHSCDVVTYEFENVPVSAARLINEITPVHPGAKALESAQDRIVEKSFINAAGIATAPFIAIDDDETLKRALAAQGGNGVLKTRRMGYDGKGQRLFRNAPVADAEGACAEMGSVPLILEGLIAFEREVSVIAARGQDGDIAIFDVAENVHRSGILHTSTVPASINPETVTQAHQAAKAILEALDYVGVIGIEFFVLADGSLLANEIAPRVHNSGHWTEAACVISQFEQHVRAIAGLALGNPKRHSNCVMENLIGEDIHRLPVLASEPDVLVHHYGKTDVRAGRKMGHFTRLSPISA